MQNSRAYGIDLPKLALGEHRFDFAVRDAFFANWPDSPLTEAAVDIVARVDKTARHVEVRFSLTGWLILECDRCLRSYSQPVQAEFRVVYTYERNLRETQDEEVIWIDRNTPFLDFMHEFYEFIVLQMPLRRIPPDCPTEACAAVLNYIANASTDDDAPERPSTASPWQALDDLRAKFTDN